MDRPYEDAIARNAVTVVPSDTTVDVRGRRISLSAASRAAPFLAALLIAAGVHAMSLDEPYHFDSSAYMKTVRHFHEHGEIRNFYPTRPVVGAALLPLSFLLGDRTLAATLALAFGIAAVLAVRLFTGLLVDRGSRGASLAERVAVMAGVAAALVVPASLVTATHGKEDFLALALALAAASVAYTGRRAALPLAGVLLGLAWLSKETALLITPFVIGVACLPLVARDAAARAVPSLEAARTALLHVAIVIAAAAATVLLVNPSHLADVRQLGASQHTGQFLGVLSPALPRGITRWREGVGDVLAVTQGLSVGLLVALRSTRRLAAALALGQVLVLAVVLLNTSVVEYRHFLWPSLFAFPLAALAITRLVLRIGGPPAVAVGLTVAAIVLPALAVAGTAFPVVRARQAYNPVATFYRGLTVERGAVLIGADNCMHASYFVRAECMTTPVAPSPAEARAFVATVRRLLAEGRSVYAIPDVFAYDRDTLEPAMREAFALVPVYENWYEDYHAMSFGLSLARGHLEVRNAYPGCKIDVSWATRPLGLHVDPMDFIVRCRANVVRIPVFVARGPVDRLLVHFGRSAVFRVSGATGSASSGHPGASSSRGRSGD